MEDAKAPPSVVTGAVGTPRPIDQFDVERDHAGVEDGKTTVASQDHESLWQAIRQDRIVVCWTFACMIGFLLYGYDLVIVGQVSSLTVFQKHFGTTYHGKLTIPSLWLGLWTAGSPIGALVGSLVGGRLALRFGRRWTIIGGTLVASVGIALTVASGSLGSLEGRRVLFLVAKMIQGVGIGAIIMATQTYLSEIAPLRLRGPTMALLPLFTLLGQLLGSVAIDVNGGTTSRAGYLVPLASQLAFSLPTFVVAAAMPESPVWLADKDRVEAARSARRRLRLTMRTEDPSVSIARHQEQTTHDLTIPTPSYLDCFHRSELPRTLIVLFAYASPQFWGLTLLANSSFFLQVLGMAESASLLVFVVGVVLGLVANACSFWTLHRFRRRTLIIPSFAFCSVAWFTIGFAGIAGTYASIIWTAAAAMLVIMVAGLSVWPACYAVGAEVSSMRLRSQSQGVGWGFSSVCTIAFSFALPYIYNVDAGDLKGKTGFVFGGLSLIATGLAWKMIPELKDKTADEIDALFK